MIWRGVVTVLCDVLWLMFEVGVQWPMVIGQGYCSEALRQLKDMMTVHGLV